MRVLAQRVWGEPALALGVLGAVAILFGKLTRGARFSGGDIAEILAPLGVGVATRQAVLPYYRDEVSDPEELQTGPSEDDLRNRN
jgi:hypothetical protein